MPKTLTWHTLKLGQIAYSLKNKESLLKKKKTQQFQTILGKHSKQYPSDVYFH